MDGAEEAKVAGNDAWKRGDLPEAIKCFSRAIELAQSNPSHDHLCIYYSNRSAAYLKKGDAKAALLDAEKCTTLDSSWAKGWGRKGAAMLALQRYTDAADSYRTAMTLEPDNTEHRKGLADAQKQTSRPRSVPQSTSVASNLTRYLKTNKGLLVLFFLRVVLLANGFLFMLPIQRGYNGYARVMLLNLAVTFIMIAQKYKGSKPSLTLAKQIIANPLVLQIGFGIIFYIQRPYIMALFIVLVPALVQVLCFLCFMFQYCNMTRPLSVLDNMISRISAPALGIADWKNMAMSTKWAKADQKATGLIAQFQVAFGLLLIFELLLPRRNFIMLVLYWQLLRMGVTMEYASAGQTGRDGDLTREFKHTHQKIYGLLSHPRCPSVILNTYSKVTEMMSKAVQMPSSNSQTSQRPGCTIA